MARYHKTEIFSNRSEYYKPLRSSRDLKSIRHYETPMIYNPGVVDRMVVLSTDHIWVYGDRFYKLANQYYGDPAYWWIIAWYNGKPTESHMNFGDLIAIPVNLHDALTVLRI